MANTEQRAGLAEQVGDLQLAAFGLELHHSCALGLQAASPPCRCEAWQPPGQCKSPPENKPFSIHKASGCAWEPARQKGNLEATSSHSDKAPSPCSKAGFRSTRHPKEASPSTTEHSWEMRNDCQARKLAISKLWVGCNS